MDGIFDISIDYAKTIRQANKLSKISGDCRDIGRDVTREVNFIEGNWKGKTGEALSRKLSLLKNECDSVADMLEHVSQTMKRVANDIREADLESIARIEKFDK